MRTSALNRWMPLLGLSPSMHILARLRRSYDLYVPNQTYDMAWPHVILSSDSSFLCPRTSCIYMHGNLTCMHYIKGSIGLMPWSSNSESIASNLSFTASEFNKAIASFRSPAIRSSWEQRKTTVKNSIAEATDCNKGQGWPRGFLRWPLSML